MNLKLLTDRLLLKTVYGPVSREITNLDTDSRNIRPGGLFICIPGYQVDGHDYAENALHNGAAAIVAQRPIAVHPGVTVILVPDTRRVLPILANAFYGNPSGKLRLIGITGTNGKTTTAHMVEHILNESGVRTGMVGTLYMRFGDEMEKTVNTTPDVIQLQRYMHSVAEKGGECVVLEVSSHGLDMGRVRGCDFQTVVFTNLSHDHLDFHHTMDNYRNAKELLFSQLGNSERDLMKKAVLNADDEASRYYAKRTSAQPITYGIWNSADIMAEAIRSTPAGMAFKLVTPWGSRPVMLPVPGEHNVYNAMAAAAACLADGVSLDAVHSALERFPGVPGRFQEVDTGKSFGVVVDYAHNPDGLKAVLQSARQITQGKLICVLGCRGERDRRKRPVMARIACAYSDYVIFTSDNAYNEDPERILAEMMSGLNEQAYQNWQVIPDRKEAIRRAVELAGDHDRVIITGRGHETSLVKGNEVDVFTDEEAVIHSLQSFHSGAEMSSSEKPFH